MQRSSTWILKSLWGACERWSKSDCIDLCRICILHASIILSYPSDFSSIASWFQKTRGIRSTNNFNWYQLLPPSVVELVETTLFKLIDQGFGAGILGAMFLFFTAGNAYLSLQRGLIGYGKTNFL